MRTERLSGALLSTLIVISLMAPVVTLISLSTASAQVAPLGSSPDIVNLLPIDDSYVMEGYPNNTRGDRYNMYVGWDPTYLRERAYLKFDLSGIPDDATIESATLKLAGRYGPSRPGYIPENMTVSIWSVSDDSWEEETLTWNNRPELGYEITRWVWRPYTEVGENYVWSLDITSYVRGEFAGDKIVSICLKSENEGENISGWFYTKDAREDQPRPVLELQGTGLYPPYAVKITPIPSYRNGLPGGTVTYQIKVRNIGYENDNIILTAEDLLGWLPEQPFSENKLWVKAGGENYATLTVRIPPNVAYRVTDNIKIIATSEGDPTKSASENVTAYTSTWLMPPEDDAEVSSGNPENNTGTRPWLHLGSSTTAYGNQRVFVKFDLGQGLPAEKEIESARLYLYCYRGRFDNITYDGPMPEGLTPQIIEIYGVNTDDWLENEITWNNMPTNIVGPLDSRLVGDSLKWYSWDVTSYVAAQRSADNIVSLVLKAKTENLQDPDNFAFSFYSKEYESVGLHPYLAIGYRVAVEASPGYRDGLPGGTVTFDVIVTNRGAAVDNYTLSATDNLSWVMTFDDDRILNLQPNESASRKLYVTIGDAADSTIDNIVITATSDGDGNMYANTRVTVHAGRRLRPPVADAYVVEGLPDNNFGGATYLDIWSSSNPLDNYNRRIFLKFDLSEGIPAGASIENARLRLFNFAGYNANMNVQIYAVEDDSWLENEITWRNQPALGSLLSTTTLKLGENYMWYEWDITSFVKSEFTTGDNIVSLCLKAEIENSTENARFRFESKEWGTIWQHPYIWIKLTGDTAGVTTSVSPPQSALAGENVRFEVTIKNTGNVGDIINLSATSDKGWPTSLARWISVGAGEDRVENLIVTIPPGTTPCTESVITVTATSMNDSTKSHQSSTTAHSGKAKFTLENLYKVSLDFDFYIASGASIVAKFYTYTDAYQTESVFWSGSPPARVTKFENIPHPQGKAVEKIRLVLTDDGQELATLATFVNARSSLIGRISKIKSRWPYAGSAERSALLTEISGIKSKWPYAPT